MITSPPILSLVVRRFSGLSGIAVVAVLQGLLLVSWESGALAACPFCPPSSPTLAEHVAGSDIVLLTTWLAQAVDPNGDGAKTSLTAIDVFKGADKGWNKGDVAVLPFARDGMPGDLVLLMGTQVGTDAPTWQYVQEIRDTTYAYVRKLPSPELPPRDRLRFFLPYLEAADPDVASDAFAEFSRAKYEEVAAIAGELPRDKLREWLRSTDVLVVRKGLYGLMIGMCGTSADARAAEEEIFRPVRDDETRLGVDGLMGGYVLLMGRPGLERIVANKLTPPEVPVSEIYAVLNLLRFLWDYGPPSVPKEDLRKALRLIAMRPNFAEGVVADQARWRDWAVLPSLLDRYGEWPFDKTQGKQKVAQFCQALLKDTDAPKELREQARLFLDEVKRNEPAVLRAFP